MRNASNTSRLCEFPPCTLPALARRQSENGRADGVTGQLGNDWGVALQGNGHEDCKATRVRRQSYFSRV